MDLSSLWDVSHLITFVGGVMLGASGQYFADRFTDQRRRQEAKTAADAKFARAKRAMPELLKEMTADLLTDPKLTIREFVVTPNRNFKINHGKLRFTYYETDHASAQNQVDLLCEEGYVDEIPNEGKQMRIYRLKEDFAARLMN